MKTIYNIAGIAYQAIEAIEAIDAVQTHCEENNDLIAIYALDKARDNIDIVLQAIENGELISRQKVADYAKHFEKYRDQSEPFSAEQFLMDFDNFEIPF
jgi:hypothetical protein